MPKKSVIRVIVVTSFNLGLLVVAVVLAVCLFTGCEDLFPKPEVKYDINGTWKLNTYQNISVNISGASGTLVVVDAATYTHAFTFNVVTYNSGGTITKITDTEFDLTDTTTSEVVRYTFSDQGRTLSCTIPGLGAMSFIR